MHDTFLLEKISTMFNTICIENKVQKVNFIKIRVNINSHINEVNLREQLNYKNKELLDNYFKIELIKDNIQEQTAIIETVQGEQFGD